MKNTSLLAVVLSAAFLVGCAGMGGSQKGGQTSAGQAVGDAAITAKVKTAIAADPELSAAKINVDTADGVVKLKGEITTLALRRKVETVAKDVSGVKSVNNQLVVTGIPKKKK